MPLKPIIPDLVFSCLLSAAAAFGAGMPDFQAGAVPVRSLDELADTTRAPAPDAGAVRPDASPGPSRSATGVPADYALPADSVAVSPADSVAAAPADTLRPSAGPAKTVRGMAWEKGLILSAETGKPVPKATVIFLGGQDRYSAQSDADGIYRLADVKPGAYALKVGKKGYAVFELQSQSFAPGGNPVREIRLERSVPKGQLIEAKGGSGAGSAAGMLAARRKTAGVMEGVGAEQIAKSTDADAGAVAKRVTGASLIGGKFVYVRGLGERYTNMTLNGLPVPSPEKDKRVVPQDLFPASAIESFSIYKTLSPDLPPDFAGGSIALVTRDIPEKNEFKVSAGVSATDYPHDGKFLFLDQNRLTYDGGNGWQNWFGFDDGTRAIPAGVPDNVNQVDYSDSARAAFARRFNNKLAVDTARLFPSPNLSVSFSRVRKLGEESRTGYTLYAGLSHKFEASDESKIKASRELLQVPFVRVINGKEFTSFKSVWDTVDGKAVPLYRVQPGLSNEITAGKEKAALTGLADWGYQDPDTRLWAKAFFVNLAEDKTFHNVITRIPGGSLALNGRDIEEHNTLEYQRRHLLTGQAGGGHYLGFSVLDSMSWAGGLAWTQTDVPDSKKWYYMRDWDNIPIVRDTVIGGRKYDSGSTAQVPGKALYYEVRSPWGTRTWENLDEKGASGRLDLKLVIPPEISRRSLFRENASLLSRIRLPQASAGLFGSYRYRAYDRTTYDWTGIASAYDSTGDAKLVERAHDPDVVARRVLDKGQGFATSTKNYETYRAGESSASGYFGLEQSFDLLRVPATLTAGMRLEWYYLDFTAPYTGPEVIQDPSLRDERAVGIHKNQLLWYPSAGADFAFFPNTKARFLYSRTLVRPEMRERAPIVYFDTDDEIDVTGNQELKDTRIENYDFRFDVFLPYNQLLSLSLFRKDFTDPVEYYIDAVAIPYRKLYQNAKSAYVQGVELEANAWLGPALRLLPGPDWFWNGFTLQGNAAWMKSEVALDTNARNSVLVTSFHRPLIGQSPYLYNAKLSHEIESGRRSLLNALIFNVFGPRIRELGADGIPDQYEQPFPSLEYLAKLTLGRHTFAFKASNLLNRVERYTLREFNHEKSYATISDDRRDSLYADVPRSYVVTRDAPGLGFSLSYTLSL